MKNTRKKRKHRQLGGDRVPRNEDECVETLSKVIAEIYREFHDNVPTFMIQLIATFVDFRMSSVHRTFFL